MFGCGPAPALPGPSSQLRTGWPSIRKNMTMFYDDGIMAPQIIRGTGYRRKEHRGVRTASRTTECPT